jgi:hypothetical protein
LGKFGKMGGRELYALSFVAGTVASFALIGTVGGQRMWGRLFTVTCINASEADAVWSTADQQLCLYIPVTALRTVII